MNSKSLVNHFVRNYQYFEFGFNGSHSTNLANLKLDKKFKMAKFVEKTVYRQKTGEQKVFIILH